MTPPPPHRTSSLALATIEEHTNDPTLDALNEIGIQDDDSTATFSDGSDNSSTATSHESLSRSSSFSSKTGVMSPQRWGEDSNDKFNTSAIVSLSSICPYHNKKSIHTDTDDDDEDDDDNDVSTTGAVLPEVDEATSAEIAAFGGFQNSPSQNNENEHNEDEETSPSSSASILDGEVLDALRASLRKNGGWDESNRDLDPKVALWIKLFHFAHGMRLKQRRSIPYGVVGLFSNVSNIRSDLLWAQDAAHRRQHGKPYISWQDFYKKEQNGLVRPYFTYAYVVASVALMLVAFARNFWQIEDLNVNPMIGPSPQVLLELGALETRLMIDNNEWWRLITPMFLHAGLIHLAFNMLAMLLLMRTIERNHGLVATSALFVVSGIAANVISALMQPALILVGASGGIFAMLGLCVADIVLNWRLLLVVFASKHWDDYTVGKGKMLTSRQLARSNCWFRFKIVFWLCMDLLLNSLVGFTPFVDNFAHMAGLVYGFLLSSTVLEHLPLSFLGAKNGFCHRFRIKSLRFVGAAISVSLMVVSVGLLSQSDGLTTPCPGCRYISCIPMPFWREAGDRWWECDDCAAVQADVFRTRGDPFFKEVEIFCPSGEVVTVDVEDERFDDLKDVSNVVPDFCRALCP